MTELFPHQQKALDALRQNPNWDMMVLDEACYPKTVLSLGSIDLMQSESRFHRQHIHPVIRYIDMANVKKGQTVPAPQWWKHLKKFNKRLFWKQQRKADHKMTKVQE